jgi:hypothetical protein
MLIKENKKRHIQRLSKHRLAKSQKKTFLKITKHKQWSTKLKIEQREPHKKLGGLRCPRRIGSSCSTDDIRRAILKSPDYHLIRLMSQFQQNVSYAKLHF